MAGTSRASEPFEALLYPNPPLSQRGYAVFMAFAVAASATMAGLFIALGAWPVSGFFGLDLVLLWIAFRVVRRNARRYEWVRVDRSDVLVRRVSPNGRTDEWRFEPCWVRVYFDEPPTPHSLVVLASHGRRIALGGFLTTEERRDFARALRAALDRVRPPLG